MFAFILRLSAIFIALLVMAEVAWAGDAAQTGAPVAAPVAAAVGAPVGTAIGAPADAPADAPAEAAPAAMVLTRMEAQEAHQGVTNDAKYVYAISNSTIGKYDRASGRHVASWSGDPQVFIHINSCEMVAGQMLCAMSNFPNVPMTSSVEWFNPVTMRHVRSHSFGPGHGSLTWIDWHDGFWWACFANYTASGGEVGRGTESTRLVKYSPDFVERESWLFPLDVLKRFGDFSASGGRWGRDGMLYVTGHTRPEMYVLRLPDAGGRLVHVRTITLPTGGQAFDWDATRPGTIWTISRDRAELVQSRLP